MYIVFVCVSSCVLSPSSCGFMKMELREMDDLVIYFYFIIFPSSPSCYCFFFSYSDVPSDVLSIKYRKEGFTFNQIFYPYQILIQVLLLLLLIFCSWFYVRKTLSVLLSWVLIQFLSDWIFFSNNILFYFFMIKEFVDFIEFFI